MDCTEWLSLFLARGPVPYRLVKESARAKGHTRGQLRDARLGLGIIAAPIRDPRTKRTIDWLWRLPAWEENRNEGEPD